MTSFVLLAKMPQATALDVENVRFGTHPDKTRMVVELSAKTDFRAFTVPQADGKPYRLVVDLPPFDWQAGQVSLGKNTQILDVRSGTLTDNIKRIVVDLKTPASIQTAYFLPKDAGKSHRLVIDFKSITPQAFASQQRQIFGTLQETQNDQRTLEALIAEKAASTSSSANGIVIPKRKPAKLSEITGTSTPARTTPLRKPLIVIDAGHGGADPGAIGANRSREKDVTLSAARILRDKLQATGRYSVHLTRDKDIYLKLYQRRNIARVKEADLFISLHADSIDKPNVRGASIYTLSNKASDAQTARLAARENQADLIAGIDLSHEDKEVADILIDLAMRDTMNQSKFFANTVVDKMKQNDIRVLTRPHRYAGFAVLKSPDVPSVLFEMGFMSNKGESRLLQTRGYQEKIATALAQSIDSYFQKVQKNSLQ